MDIKIKSLEKKYWDNLEDKYPGYIEYFLQYARQFLEKHNMNELDFYTLPYQFQLAIFYDYVAHHGCNFELDVCDYDVAIEEMEEYFCEEKMSNLAEKQAFKSGSI